MLNAMDTRGNKRTTFIVVMDTATVWDTFDPRGNIYEKRERQNTSIFKRLVGVDLTTLSHINLRYTKRPWQRIAGPKMRVL